jgi:hypothetical protein
MTLHLLNFKGVEVAQIVWPLAKPPKIYRFYPTPRAGDIEGGTGPHRKFRYVGELEGVYTYKEQACLK